MKACDSRQELACVLRIILSPQLLLNCIGMKLCVQGPLHGSGEVVQAMNLLEHEAELRGD